MHIAICGPTSLKLLKDDVENGNLLPKGYIYPFTAYLAKEYIRMGHNVSIVTCTEDVEKVTYFKGKNLCLIIAPLRKRARHYITDFYRKEVRIMREELIKIKPDIIHAQWTYEFADAALKTGIPTLVTARDSPLRIAWIMRTTFRWLRALYSTLYVIPRIKNLSANSAHLGKDLKQLHGVTRPISIVPNGIDEFRFLENPKFLIRNRNNLNLVCISEWGRHKNIKTLLKAFNLLLNKNGHLKLIVFGRGLGVEDAGCKWATQQGLTNSVEFRGYQSQDAVIACLRKEADLFISPTLEESLGMIFVEAMAQGVACVGGSTSGAVPWVLDNGESGFLVNVKSSDKLSADISRIIEDPNKIELVAKRGYERAKKMFLMANIGKSFVKEYEHILAITHEKKT